MPFVEPRAQLGERRIGGRLLRLDFGGVRRRLSGSRVAGAPEASSEVKAGSAAISAAVELRSSSNILDSLALLTH